MLPATLFGGGMESSTEAVIVILSTGLPVEDGKILSSISVGGVLWIGQKES